MQRVALSREQVYRNANELSRAINGRRFQIKDLLLRQNQPQLYEHYAAHISIMDLAYKALSEKAGSQSIGHLEIMLESAGASLEYLREKVPSVARATSHAAVPSELPEWGIIDYSKEYPFPLDQMLDSYSRLLRNHPASQAFRAYGSCIETSIALHSRRYSPKGFVNIDALLENSLPNLSNLLDLSESKRQETEIQQETSTAEKAAGNPEERKPGESSRAKLRWNDFIGPDEIVGYFQDLCSILKSIKYAKTILPMDVLLPKGILLQGKPGTGKTTLARIFSEESGLPFRHVTVSDIGSTFVYGAAEKLQEQFDLASEDSKKHGNSILFLDEIDVVAPSRESTNGDEEKKVTAVLCTNMDGTKAVPGVIVLGATNHYKAIDPALLRPGRFGKVISFPDLGKDEMQRLWSHYRQKYRAGFERVDDYVPDFSERNEAGRVACDSFTGAMIKETVISAYRNALIKHLKGEDLTVRKEDWKREVANAGA